MKKTKQCQLAHLLQKTEKENPFHLHKTSNAASQALVHLRTQSYILNKLSLLPNVLRSSLDEELFELSVACIEGVSNNPSLPLKHFETVRDLIAHIELYYKRLIMNRSPS